MIEQAKYIAEKEPADSGRWKHGTSAKFLQTDPSWGVKFYASLRDREYTWNLQNIAAQAELAPAVGDWIDSRLGYGYLTMVADTEKDKSREEIEKLYKKLQKIGFHNDSLDFRRPENCGYFDETLVCIDFDAAWLFRIVPTASQSFACLRIYPETTKAVGEPLNWKYTKSL